MITWYSAQCCTRPLTDVVFAVFIRISTFIVVVYLVYEKGIDKYVISIFSMVIFKPDWLHMRITWAGGDLKNLSA